MVALLLLLLQTSPADAFGHEVGADGKLARWAQVVEYFRTLDRESDRVVVEERGKTTEGNPYILVAISSAANIARLDEIKRMQRELADPRGVGPVRKKKLLEEAPVVVFFNCTQHSTEIASTQTVTEMAWRLATRAEDEILRNTVVLIVPSANPDGIDKVTDWYEKTKGQPWEGAYMPWTYHKYVDHDTNRDWFMLTQVESQLYAKIAWEEWYPAITVDLHQMGSDGERFFIAPFIDPINPNIPPIVNQQQLLIGGHVVTDLTMAGKRGAVHQSIFDNWWHGDHSAASHRHNQTGILTETASVRIASPVFVERGDLDPKEPTVRFPEPWPGGWWRLRDIVDYQLVSNESILTLAARYRDRFNANYLKLAADAVERGRTEPPFAYVVPDTTAGVRLLRVLRRGGVEIHRARAPVGEHPAGSYVVLLAQPFRAHVKDLMERQVYPDQFEYPGGPPAEPYDVTGWTLPLQMGVRAVAVADPFEADLERVDAPAFTPGRVEGAGPYLMEHTTNEAFIAVNRLHKAGARVSVERGRAFIEADRAAVEPLTALGLSFTTGEKPEGAVESKPPRIGLYQPWTASMDEGWTRWVLEQYEFPYATIRNAEMRAGSLRYDAIVIPSMDRGEILDGRERESVPPEYAGGIGREGVIALQEFVEAGGTLVLLDAACGLAGDFGTAVREFKDEAFYCPGSIVRLRLDASHPLAWGMPEETAAFVDRSPVFDLKPADDDEPRKRAAEKFPATAVGKYPDSMILMSGWIKGEEKIAGKAALVEVAYGKGRLVLFGMRPQHRGQPHATFRLLFNAISR